MTQTSKSPTTPEFTSSAQPISEYYAPNGPAVEYIGDIEDEVRVRQVGEQSRLAERADEFTQKVGEKFDRASVAVQKAAQRTRVRAEQGARSTADTARSHPVATAAVIGGIATAALAGVSIYRASKRTSEIKPQRAVAMQPTRKPSISKTGSKKKH